MPALSDILAVLGLLGLVLALGAAFAAGQRLVDWILGTRKVTIEHVPALGKDGDA